MPSATDLQKFPFPLLKAVASLLLGHGWGSVRPLNAVYKLLAHRLIPGNQQTIEVNGCLFKITASAGEALDSVTHSLFLKQTYEPLTTAVLLKILRRGMKVIDVGANIGYYSLLAAKLVGDSGKVWAFEPEPVNYSRLLENIRLNNLSNIEPLPKAVTDTAGTASLYLSAIDSGKHSLIRLPLEKRWMLKVEAVMLDGFFADVPVDILKTDTEGSELEVLRGAKNLISGNKGTILLAEFWPYGLKAAGHQPEELWRLLTDYGFKHIYIIDERKKAIEEGDLALALRCCKKQKDSVNLVCAKDSVNPLPPP